jgi:alpha-mannosidase
VKLVASQGTDIFRGSGSDLQQGIRLRIDGLIPGAILHARVDGGEPAQAVVDINGEALVLAFTPQREGATGSREVAVWLRSGRFIEESRETVRFGQTGWTLHLAPHFHYDPVWWNTQAGFLSEWETLPAAIETRMVPEQRTAFELMRAHLDRAKTDPDYRFVVAEVDYLKPWWDTFPAEREFIRRLIAEGRIDVVGGAYNEPSTTLVSVESTIRNVISGMGYQRTVLQADPTMSWMLDVFGHDPQFPSIMADAGLRGTSWARGPFHEGGPMATRDAIAGDVDPRMQFDAEFEWMSPNGRGLLTSYLTSHYISGWWMHNLPTLEAAENQIYKLFSRLKTVAATPHVLVLVGMDHILPNRWVTDIHRDWAEKYTWPRFVVSTPSRYLAAVEAELSAKHGILTTQTRDMNPVFAGTAVSYTDTKQANRAAEVALIEAETLAALAWSRGLAPSYPAARIDHAWRQLAFGAHHDAITGSESDQVYIDLLGSWRSAWSTAAEVRAEASRALLSARSLTGEADSVTVVNGVSTDRTDVVRVSLTDKPGGMVDADGSPVASVVSGDEASGWTVEFVADVPATGFATFRVDGDPAAGWEALPDLTIANESFALTVDAGRGGTVSSLRDLAAGVELITPGAVGNEILVYSEYKNHPKHGYGPWLLAPTGAAPLRSSAATVERVTAERSAAGQRITVSGSLAGMAFRQTLTLWAGVPRVDAVTTLDFAGSDQVVRIAWPCAVPGARPVAQVGGAVIGRNIAHPDADAREFPWGAESTCHEWFGLSAPVRVRVSGAAGEVVERAVAVAEIVNRDLTESAAQGRALAQALVRCGVTSTNSLADGIRYGDQTHDSNQPDFRIALGTAETNSFIAEVLAGSDPSLATALDRLAKTGHGMLLVPAKPSHDVTAPGATVMGALDLPVLIVTGDVPAAVAAMVADLDDAILEVTQDVAQLPADAFADRSVAIINRGLPGYAVDAAGTLYLSALRSSTGWPSGLWLNEPQRYAPDGSWFQLQHWTHDFEYAIVAGAGDWRAAGFAAQGQAFAHPFTTVVERGVPAAADARASLLRVEPATVVAAAVKQSGNPLAFPGDEAIAGGLTIRLAESLGRDATATVTLGDAGIESAHLTDLLEHEVGDSVLAGGGIEVPVGGFDSVTIRARAAGAAPAAAPAAGEGALEFSRYWLHNTGTAPVGNHPVAVQIVERAGAAAGSVGFDVVLAAETPDLRASGRLRLEVSGGARLTGPADVAVAAPDEVHMVPITVELDAAAGTSFAVSATFVSGDGLAVYDAAAFSATGERLAATDVTERIELGWGSAAVEVAAGGSAELVVEVRNTNPFDLRGQLLLLTPWGTWSWIDRWSAVVEVPAGEARRYTFPVAPEPGAHRSSTWAIAKLGALGTVSYSETTPLIVS